MKLVEYYIYKDYSDIVRKENIIPFPDVLAELFVRRSDIDAFRYEMTTFCRRVVNNMLYFGCTNYAGDFLLALDIAYGDIRSCNYARIREPNEHKIHKGLWYDESDHSLIFATSTLSTIDKLAKAPCGK